MKKNNYAITANNLSVKYRTMKSFSIKKSIFNFKNRKREKFEALKNVSFNIEKGRIVGIIGKNGSGKSTLLKTIAGVFSPDEGELNTYNNTVSLLAIGIGFKANLSGYENIFLSGLLLGFTENQIKEKINEIIEFSELGEFIYKPVKTYSSGMHSKLAFAITALLDTDIILIDEVLSVGDINFKEKSERKMKQIIQNRDKTVIIVSHSLSTLTGLCDEVIWIDDGRIKEFGETNQVIENYAKFMESRRKK